MVEINLPPVELRLDHGRPFTAEERRKAREPVAAAIGHFLIVWCILHEDLSRVYVAAYGDLRKWQEWRSRKMDSRQRKLLADALKQPQVQSRLADATVLEIEQLLSRIEEIADDRNNAAHAPYAYVRNGEEVLCLPDWLCGDDRAGKIAGTDFLAKVDRLTSEIDLLAGKARSIAAAIEAAI